MQIICVDDEAPVLAGTVALCEALPQKPQTEGFQSGADALDWLETHDADIALLDIRMQEMDGLVLAKRIKELRPETAVIFLTSHAQYALDAFGVHASGYLLKPTTAQRLADEVAYAMAGRRVLQNRAHVEARTFGEFDLLINGRPVMFGRARAKELLAYLIDRQGSYVSRANAFSVLWEDAQYDRSMQKQLDVVIRSLRTTLERAGIGDLLEIHKGYLRILPEKLDCDLYRFLAGERNAIGAYRGEYMSAYGWASLTESYLARIRQER